jgi:hypothetical protein
MCVVVRDCDLQFYNEDAVEAFACVILRCVYLVVRHRDFPLVALGSSAMSVAHGSSITHRQTPLPLCWNRSATPLCTAAPPPPATRARLCAGVARVAGRCATVAAIRPILSRAQADY